jgi:hypothetical protein
MIWLDVAMHEPSTMYIFESRTTFDEKYEQLFFGSSLSRLVERGPNCILDCGEAFASSGGPSEIDKTGDAWVQTRL